MKIEWVQVFERIHSHPDAGAAMFDRAVSQASKVFANSPQAQAAWEALKTAPPATWRKKLSQALLASGLSDELTEANWRALLHQAPHTISDGVHDDLFFDAMQVAATQINKIEWPPLSNFGEDLRAYTDVAHFSPGDHWCMVFVVWCVSQATKARGAVNPLAQTGSCYEQWQHALKVSGSPHGALAFVTPAQMRQGAVLRPGAIFIHQNGDDRTGHTGFVESIDAQGRMVTIEGNANPFGVSKVGLGVFRCQHRHLDDKVLKGFIELR
jgi:hypothetical protein